MVEEEGRGRKEEKRRRGRLALYQKVAVASFLCHCNTVARRLFRLSDRAASQKELAGLRRWQEKATGGGKNRKEEGRWDPALEKRAFCARLMVSCIAAFSPI